VIPLQAGERSVADAILALFDDTRVAIATDDTSLLPPSLPPNIVIFSRRDFVAGSLPKSWPSGDALARSGSLQIPETSTKSDATRRLRAVAVPSRAPAPDAAALLDDELAWYRASGIGFAVVSLTIPGETAAAATATLAGLLRSDDRVSPTERGCVAILAGADAVRARHVVTRLSMGMRKESRRKVDAVHAAASEPTIGVAICPHDGTTANALLAAARRRPPQRRKPKEVQK
jgi:hypothetical protein